MLSDLEKDTEERDVNNYQFFGISKETLYAFREMNENEIKQFFKLDHQIFGVFHCLNNCQSPLANLKNADKMNFVKEVYSITEKSTTTELSIQTKERKDMIQHDQKNNEFVRPSKGTKKREFLFVQM